MRRALRDAVCVRVNGPPATPATLAVSVARVRRAWYKIAVQPSQAMEPNAELSTTVAPGAAQPLRRELRSWGRDLVIALSLAIVIIIFFYQPVKVEGTSMTPLISDQERIFINKFVYRFEPIERGDVVVFWYPLDRSKSFIKRVVGLPGEMVEIRKGIVYVNGVALPEPYVPPQYEDLTDYPATKVAEHSYFVMGDHRISSNDSRVFGTVPSHFIYGRAVFAYWPVDHFGSLSATSTTEAKTK
jgi:signal peptidase I